METMTMMNSEIRFSIITIVWIQSFVNIYNVINGPNNNKAQ